MKVLSELKKIVCDVEVKFWMHHGCQRRKKNVLETNALSYNSPEVYKVGVRYDFLYLCHVFFISL